MKEFKILVLLALLTGVTYWGIEPYAHSVMHPHLEKADFEFKDLEPVKGEGNITNGKELVADSCTDCHTVKAAGHTKIADISDLEEKYGKSSHIVKNFQKFQNRYIAEDTEQAVPLDLSNVGTIFNAKFLKNFIKNPSYAAFDSTYIMHKEYQLAKDIDAAMNENSSIKKKTATDEEIETYRAAIIALRAAKNKELDAITETDKAKRKAAVEAIEAKAKAALNKFNKDNIIVSLHSITKNDIAAFVDKEKIQMPGTDEDSEVNDIVAYLKSIAQPVSDKEATILACGRCHSIEYDKVKATTPNDILNKYLGTTPPDLSMMIRSKGRDYLTIFLNDPQKVLIGSSMPRVGINEKTEGQIVTYLEKVGDAKKADRESLGLWVIGYMMIFTLLAYLWKRKIWSEVK